MKFYNDMDEQIFSHEIKTSGLNEVEFIKKRQSLVKNLKDRRKSNVTKQLWKSSRFKMMKGIKRYHKSTKGKRFHRDLGRFLATRDLTNLAYRECRELIVHITSCLTHAYYELGWYMNIEDSVDYELFLDEVYNEVLIMLGKLQEYSANLEDHAEFLYRLCETSAIVNAFADKYNKSKEDIEKLWIKAKGIVKAEYKLGEEDDRFFSLLMGVLKKMLNNSSKRSRIRK